MKCGRRPEWRTEKDELYNSLTAGLWGIITSWREGEAELREIEEEIASYCGRAKQVRPV